MPIMAYRILNKVTKSAPMPSLPNKFRQELDFERFSFVRQC